VSLERGTRLGPYEIDSVLGAGGMGEVYRARDTRLKRDVAVKVLPPAFAHDPDRLARFQREAEVLATLNHPNIAAVYGFEEAKAASGIVLELVEGPTLRERIAHSPIPIDEALAIARQIADALEAAHEKNVIHRDLKPANIKVTPNGTVKVLDFGLAKMMDSAASNQHKPAQAFSMSPTFAIEATSAGLILGTAGYMSPEQARGKPVDGRTDIWSFGCVLFEMLTARQVFETGETVSDAVAAILTREPDWNALPANLPAPIRRLLRRCLEKDPDRRLHHAADARLEIADAMSAPVSEPVPALTLMPSSRPRLVPWAVTAVAIGLAIVALWTRSGSTASATSPVRRLELTLPTGVELFASNRSVAVSPDGSRVVFVGVRSGTRQVYLRSLDQFEAIALRGSDSATATFFAPDGRAVGLVTNTGALRTVSLADGLVTTVTDGVNFLYGATWGEGNRIVFVRAGALWQVAASGGTPTQLTMLGGSKGDTLHAQPVFLPGGETLLFGAASGERWRVESVSIATGERRIVIDRATMPLYAASGHLIFFRDGELLAAPFDLDSLEVKGTATQAIEKLPTQLQGLPSIDISASGTVAYAPTTAVSRLVWVSREGVEQPVNELPRSYSNPRIGPDRNRLLVQAGDLWVHDIARSTFTRLTSRDIVINAFPMWLPDGRNVIYRSPNGLSIQDSEGSGQGQLVMGTSDYDYPAAVGPDGDTLVFMRSTQETSFDILLLSLRNPSQVRPWLKTTAYEGGAQLSPDGKWLTYVSNESGQNEVYLRQFEGPDRRWTISTEGGTQPLWNPNGREIFYRNGDKMMAVAVATTPDIKLSTPRALFEQRYAFGAGITIANYDVAADGQRFIMVRDEAGAARLNVVLNWLSELGRVAPAGSSP
jgi:serine/threonine protein kinase/Tol biopolymer transport system component